MAKRQAANSSISSRIWIILGLMSMGIIKAVLADPPVASHADSFSKEGLFKADASKLKDTQLVPDPDVPLQENQNVLWCGTFQLVWNKAIALVGEKLHFLNQPPLVNLLNRQDFTDADLDPASYIARADFERNNVEDKIRAALEETFHGAASPELIPPKPANPGPDDFVAYAYLYKNLSFTHPFQDNDPLTFAAQPVQNFGYVKNRDQVSSDVSNQVLVYDYQSPDNFIVQLKTKSTGDELILAKFPPGATLEATMNDVLQRMAAHKPEVARKQDPLAVPKLNFDLRKSFRELEGLVLQPGPAARIKGRLVIGEAQQLVRFQLNEKGAILKSEAVIVMRALAMPSAPARPMIFDQPFLILMKQANSDHPYFALWVGNASLLVPADK